MEQQDFEIKISPEGEVRIRIRGTKGKSCVECVEFLTQVLGPVKAMQRGADFYDPDAKVRIDVEAGRRGS